MAFWIFSREVWPIYGRDQGDRLQFSLSKKIVLMERELVLLAI